MKLEINNNERILIKSKILDFINKAKRDLNRIDLPRDEYYKYLENELNTAEKLMKKL